MRAYNSSHFTRERLMLAAEALVAQRGIGGVSAREIAKAAGLRNNCSVQYHFGSMEGLFQEHVRYRMGQLEEIRQAMIEEAGDSPDIRTDPHRLMQLICLPHLKIRGSDGTHSYAAFLCQYLPIHHPMGFRWVMRSAGTELPTIRWIIQSLRANLDSLSLEMFDRRLTSASLLFLNTLQGLSRSKETDSSGDDHDGILEDAIRQGVAVLTAPTEGSSSAPARLAPGPQLVTPASRRKRAG